MNFAIALTVIQFIITMMFCPLRVGARGHASLARDKMEFDLSLFGLPVAKIRIKRKEHVYKLNINGKSPKKDKNLSFKQVMQMARQYKFEGIETRGNLLALIGTNDAKNTAIAYALLDAILSPVIKNVRIFTSNPLEAFEIDGRIRVRINIVQIMGLIIAAI